MMKAVILTLLLAFSFSTLAIAQDKQSAFDRVMTTNTLKCGYWPWPPLMSVDPNSGQISGLFKDYMEEVGRVLNLTIEWVETPLSGFLQDLQYDRVDALCAGILPVPAASRNVEFTSPVFYTPMHIYARAGDKRFDNQLDTLNDPAITIISKDGLAAAEIIAVDFPHAKKTMLTDLNPNTDIFESVKTKKADATLMDILTAQEYMKANPGVLRQVPHKYPVRVFGQTVAVKKDEMKLKRSIDIATEQLLANGSIEKILQKYEPTPGAYLRVAKPYEVR
jgi:ABC-type amino acid transport substrate-binding protein